MTPDLPRIIFCITCKNRTQHLRQTLLKNIEDNLDYPNARFVLVNYGSQDDMMDFVRDEVREKWEDNLLTVYTYPNWGPFRMAHAKNMAHRLAISEGADILVNLDADNFTGPGFATWIEEQMSGNPHVFFGPGRIIKGVTPRGLSGRIIVWKHQFLQAGGYDEHYENWGPDDKDFNVRLRRLGYEWRGIPDQFLDCVRHNDKMRFKEYPEAACGAESDAEVIHLRTSDETVVNFGMIGCGVVTRNLDFLAIQLPRIPTRVFGIGMHKTGTTSLHHAFRHLGMNSAHWPSAHWAKRVWREMNATGRSNALESFYAMSDMPFAKLFRKLDDGYPGSKFVLTIRDEATWLESVRKHWDPNFNPWRSNWDSDPFTHQIHGATYGRTDFDAETMLTAYRHHNADVRKYFRSRPHDLLVFNVDENTNWRPLCSFLGQTCPNIPYPRSNVVS